MVDIFFDSFENDDATRTPYVTAGEAVLPDNAGSFNGDNPHHGIRNLRSYLPASQTDQYAMEYYDVAGFNPVYARLMNAKFSVLPTTAGKDVRVLSFAQLTSGEALGYAGVINDGGTLKWFIRAISTGTTFTNYLSVTGNVPSAGTNYVIEAGIYRANGTGYMRLYVDGVLEVDTGNVDNDARNLNYAWAGYSFSDSDGLAYFYGDCLQLAEAYIGSEVSAVNRAIKRVLSRNLRNNRFHSGIIQYRRIV